MNARVAAPRVRRRPSFALLMTVLIVAELVCSLESNMIYVALSTVYKATGDPVHAAWLITAFTLTAAGAAAVASPLGDIYGRRQLLTVMLGVALAGSLISAFAGSLDWVIVGRALQGASMAILPLCYGILRENAPIERIPSGVGLLGGTYGFGTGGGAMIGGFIVEHIQWQGIFAVSAGLAVIALIAVVVILPPSPQRLTGKRVDILGGILFAPAVASILLGLTFLKGAHWYEPIAYGPFLAGFALLAIWAWHELRIDQPLISLKLLRHRQIALANLGMFAIGIGPMMITLINVPLLQQARWSGAGFGLAAGKVGTIWFVLCLIGGVFTIGSGYLANRAGTRLVVLVAATMTAVGWASMPLLQTTLTGTLLCSALLLNPGVTLIYGMIPSLVIEAAPEERTSEATGLTQVVRSIGMAIGSLLVPYLLATHLVVDPGGSGQKLPGPSGYVAAFLMVAATSAFSAVCIALLPRHRPAR